MWGVDMDVTSFTSRGKHEVCRGKFLRTGFRQSAGFTLVELLSAITIVLIIFGIGIPVLKTTVTTNRLATSINALAGTLAYTRSEAIRRNQHVVMCKSMTGTECTQQGNWREGWVGYVDMNRNRSLDASETILGSHRLGEVAFGMNPGLERVLKHPLSGSQPGRRWQGLPGPGRQP